MYFPRAWAIIRFRPLTGPPLFSGQEKIRTLGWSAYSSTTASVSGGEPSQASKTSKFG